MKSMTGYGRGESTDGIRTAVVEIRTVNHRYAEISVRLPRRYGFAEDAVKKTLRDYVARGKTEVGISVTSLAESESAVSINSVAAGQYLKGLSSLMEDFGLEADGSVVLSLLAAQPDVLHSAVVDLDEEAAGKVVVAAVRAAAENLDAMRREEGGKLTEDLLARADGIEGILDQIEARAPALPGIYRDRLHARIAELLAKDSGNLPDISERIALEVAVFADKCSITEELVRLRSHIGQLRGILRGTGEPVGKKLDFLVQEMNREANTIGSKANDLKITQQMLEMKSEVEKIREQVQNLE
ncbi:MAG: YicC family protein [Clostridiales Family XIII bacterium]|jgi:uncharacterized protein (TIGR00255 family)|nr:YicC family protein [Clostridiales Family XIII bacterium]